MRKGDQHDAEHDEDEEIRQRRLGDGRQLFAGNALNDEQVESDRRVNLRNLNDDHEEDAKPDCVEVPAVCGAVSLTLHGR